MDRSQERVFLPTAYGVVSTWVDARLLQLIFELSGEDLGHVFCASVKLQLRLVSHGKQRWLEKVSRWKITLEHMCISVISLVEAGSQ